MTDANNPKGSSSETDAHSHFREICGIYDKVTSTLAEVSLLIQEVSTLNEELLEISLSRSMVMEELAQVWNEDTSETVADSLDDTEAKAIVALTEDLESTMKALSEISLRIPDA